MIRAGRAESRIPKMKGHFDPGEIGPTEHLVNPIRVTPAMLRLNWGAAELPADLVKKIKNQLVTLFNELTGKPGRDCYIEVESLPILGTGKLDLKGIKEIALATLGG